LVSQHWQVSLVVLVVAKEEILVLGSVQVREMCLPFPHRKDTEGEFRLPLHQAVVVVLAVAVVMESLRTLVVTVALDEQLQSRVHH